jgi:hypothetical protein
VGACIGSGAAQIMAVGLMWSIGIHLFKVKLPWMQVAKITFISILAALTAHYVAMQFAPLWAVLLGGAASLVVLFACLYIRCAYWNHQDRERFNTLAGHAAQAEWQSPPLRFYSS